MMQQTENDAGEPLPSLRAKLQRFVNELTPEELAYLRSSPADAGRGELPPGLEAKAERAVEDLTQEEDAQFQHLVQKAAGVEAEVAGYLKPLYDDGWGYKGPPGTNPAYNQPGGSNLSGRGARFVQNLQSLFGSIGDEAGNYVNLPFL